MNYTEEQQKDIVEREAKALEMLKELEMTPVAHLVSVNIGENVFGTKVYVSLKDTKYDKKIESPYIKDEPDTTPENPVEA